MKPIRDWPQPPPPPRPPVPTSNPLLPGASLLAKLGSIVVHVDEFFSEGGHIIDRIAISHLLGDPEVITWIALMTVQGMLPVKR